MSIHTKMTAIADEIRELSGTTEAMGLDAMATHVSDANDEVDTQADLLAQIQTALEGKTANNGVQLPSLTNPADVSEVFSGKEYIDESGSKQTGTFTIDDEVTEQVTLIEQIKTALQGKTSGNTELKLQEKTITPSKNSQTVTPDDGYDGLSSVVINGDSNLIAENIKSGVSIFGVEGNVESGDNTQTATATVTVVIDAPIGSPEEAVYYMSPDGVKCIYLSDYELTSFSINCIVPSIIATAEISMNVQSGGITKLYGYGSSIYEVTSSGALYYG